MTTQEPNWTEDELALRVAYELSPRLRTLFPTFELAMNDKPVAAALRTFAHAWQRQQQRSTAHGQGRPQI